MEEKDKKNNAVLHRAAEHPPQHYLAIIGGDRLAEKIPVISGFIDKASTILLGGAVAYTFLKAKGEDVGNSKTDDAYLKQCLDILNKAEERNVRIVFPSDHIAAIRVEPEITIKMIREGETIPDTMMGLDIGFKTIHLFSREIEKAGLIVWYGPLGVFEIDTFAAGTTEILKAVAQSSASSIIIGEALVLAAEKIGVSAQISYISKESQATLKTLIKGN